MALSPHQSSQARTGKDNLRSVTNAIDVLDCFAEVEELGVSDVARRLGIAKSTAHRLLTTLAHRRLIEQNPATGHYRLGLHLFELGQLAQQRIALRRVALPLLEDLRRVTGHTVHLGVLDGVDVVYAERLESAETRRLMAGVARRFPAHATSSGKVIAAFNTEVALARLDQGFPASTPGTITSARDYAAALRETARRGVGVNHGEAVSGLSSVGAPIRDLNGTAYAAVTLVAPTTRMVGEIDRAARLVLSAARSISARLPVAC